MNLLTPEAQGCPRSGTACTQARPDLGPGARRSGWVREPAQPPSPHAAPRTAPRTAPRATAARAGKATSRHVTGCAN